VKIPPFPELVRDEFFFAGEDVLPVWAGFQSRRGPYCAIDRHEPSDGSVRVSVKPAGAEPTGAQRAAYEFLLAEQRAIRDAVLARILAEYPEIKRQYELDTDEALPEVNDAAEFRSLLGLANVHVLTVERDGRAYLGLEFGCEWEEEHGLGVLTHGARVVDVGHAEVAFNDWIPRHER
jgi:hypothetical protein